MKVAVLALLLVACSPTRDGAEGGACYGNGTCDDGLVCVRWGGREFIDNADAPFAHARCSKPENVSVGGYTPRMPTHECLCPADGGVRVWR